jgi:hypothetical protein
MTCPGSVAMEAGYPNEDNDASASGTVDHYIASQVLPPVSQPLETFAGRVIKEGAFAFEVDDERLERVKVYTDLIRDYAQHGTLLVEQKLPIGWLTGEEDAEGTSDAVILAPDELIVADAKFGYKAVDVATTPQLRIYALAAKRQYELLHDFKQVRCVIIQPRLSSSPQEVVYTLEELDAFEQEVRKAANKALMALSNYTKAALPLELLKPSEHGCEWCRAKAECPALAAFVQRHVGADFEALADPLAPPNRVEVLIDKACAETSPFTEVEDDISFTLSSKLMAVPLIEDWCRAIRGRVEARLLEGKEVHGFKLVQGRKGARQWSDEDEVTATLKGFRLRDDEIYAFKLLGPAGIEKLLKPNPKRWAKVEGLITQAEGKLSVAPKSDKRPAVTPGSGAEDFEAVDEMLV